MRASDLEGAIFKPSSLPFIDSAGRERVTVYGQSEYLAVHTKDTDAVKALIPAQLRRYDPVKRCFVVKVTSATVKGLVKTGLPFDEAAGDLLAYLKTKPTGDSLVDLKNKLRPYQYEGVHFIDSRGGNALLGDEMGLGKTIQAIAYAKLHPRRRPVVVVCPAHLKENWAEEIAKWTGESTHIINGRYAKGALLPKAHWYIVNYDVMPSSKTIKSFDMKTKQEKERKLVTCRGDIIATAPQILVLDEVQYLKNQKSDRTKAVTKFLAGIPHKIALSGTPIKNRPIEFWPVLHMLDDETFHSYEWYLNRFCGPSPRQAKGGKEVITYKGASNTEELYKLLTETVMIRRLKKDVLQDLPEKNRSIIPLSIDPAKRKEYEKADEDIMEYIARTTGMEVADSVKKAEVLVRMTKLAHLAAKIKLPQTLAFIENAMEEVEKMVVFAHHKDIVSQIVAFCDKQGYDTVQVTGDTPLKARHEAVKKFQEGSARVFVGNIQAAGTGLTLTAASLLVFAELTFVPADLLQCEDRIHRIGQKDIANIVYLVAPKTIEDVMAKAVQTKSELLGEVLDGNAKGEVDESSLAAMFRTYFTTMRKKNGKDTR